MFPCVLLQAVGKLVTMLLLFMLCLSHIVISNVFVLLCVAVDVSVRVVDDYSGGGGHAGDAVAAVRAVLRPNPDQHRVDVAVVVLMVTLQMVGRLVMLLLLFALC